MTEESMEFERLRRQAVEIGEGRLTGRWEELLAMLSSAAPRVRRAAASALGKLAEADRSLHPAFVAPLFLRAMDETGDQVREYLFKALARCSSAMSAEMVKGVRDVVRNPTLKAYVRAAANEALSAGERAVRGRAIALRRECVRCHARISPEESEVAMMRYGKPYCRHCLDERMLEDVHFEKDVTAAKRLRTTDHIAVQSRGEKRIGDWLAQQGIRYIYDERYRIVADAELRPDFYLPEFDIYIEYWGMDTDDYLDRKKMKQLLYQRAGKRLISLGPKDLPDLERILHDKLARYIALEQGATKDSDRSAVSRPSSGNGSASSAVSRPSLGNGSASSAGSRPSLGNGSASSAVSRPLSGNGSASSAVSRPSLGNGSASSAVFRPSSGKGPNPHIIPHPAPKPSLWLATPPRT